MLYIEAQAAYALACLRELHRRGNAWMAVSAPAMDAHNRALQGRLAASVWAGPCSSWYKTAAGHVAAIYPGYSFQYTRALRHPRFEDYVFG